MTESTLNALMKLFAIIANLNKEAAGVLSRNFVESFLKTQFSFKLVEQALEIFDSDFNEFANRQSKSEIKRTSSLSVQVLHIYSQINKELSVKDRYLILFSLIHFSRFFESSSTFHSEFRQTVSDAVETIAEGMHIDRAEFENCRAFLEGKFHKLSNRKALLVINSENKFSLREINHLKTEKLKGQLFFLKIFQANIYVFHYSGQMKLELNGKNIFSDHTYILPRGSSIKGEDIMPVYFNQVEAAYLKKGIKHPVSLVAKEISYSFPDSDGGVRPLSFSFKSGDFIGIMGGSGSGKSTLMNMLSGKLPLDQGKVLINGISVHEQDEHIKKMIGYVPQDDLLIEELTVFQNLYYSSLLSLGNLEKIKVEEIVDDILMRLELSHISHLRVGSPENRQISGGQRKRLNIALELVRQPYILFTDEPTSGLSSTDSENVMHLLKEQTMQGKIVIVNIHQPSSAIFKMFDEIIIMDQGGFPVYTGNPIRAFPYLKSVVHRADKEEIECETCGKIQTGDILKIIESKKVNEFGEYTRERKLMPSDWYKYFIERIQSRVIFSNEQESVPPLYFKNPSGWNQFIIYSTRNLLAKVADKQFVLFALLVPPLLAVILGYFTKYVAGTDRNEMEYLFSANENLPAYIFMSVIVSLFVGLIISAEEIIKDRRIMERESYLNLNRGSYLNSKIIFLFVLTAIQMFVFVSIGNSILQIKGLYSGYWLALFSSGAFAVLLGLNISSGLKSLIAVYINIPFILVPLILLAGVIVKYDKLHPGVASAEYVPLAGDLMASRWAYEALVVNQFLNNDYQKHFTQPERKKINYQYEVNFLIPELLNRISDYERAVRTGNNQTEAYAYTLIENGLVSLSSSPPDFKTSGGKINTGKLRTYLVNYKKILAGKISQLNIESDKIIENMINEGIPREDIVSMKNNFENESIRDLVMNNNELRKVEIRKGKIIRKYAPVYQKSKSKTGRAQFYASQKKLGNFEIDTFAFNISVIWFMNLVLYILLYFEGLKKLIEMLQKRKIIGISLSRTFSS